MRRKRTPEEIPDLLDKCTKYGLTYTRACWLLDCPIIDPKEGQRRMVIRNMSEYDQDHHLYKPEGNREYYVKLQVGSKTFREKVGMDIEQARRIRDEMIQNLQAMLDSGQLDYLFKPNDSL